MSDWDDYDEAPDYNRANGAGQVARRGLIERPSRAPICTTCGQRQDAAGVEPRLAGRATVAE
jgi:hypothetical protein